MGTLHSIADRQAKEDAAAARLDRMLSELTTTETFRAYLRAMASFHRYSWANVAMILSQRPDATRVNAYKRWQDLGRQVKKGEKGIAIWTPRIGKNDDGEQVLTGFGIGYVFDISQTEGDDLPDAPSVTPITGSSPRALAAYDALAGLVADRGVSLSIEDTLPALGYWKPSKRLVALDTSLSGNAATSVLVHETAHMLADHRGAISKADAESVAEGVAFVVMTCLDVDTSGFSVPYIAGWAEDVEVLRRNLGEVQQLAHTIIETIEAWDTDGAGSRSAA